MSASLSPFDLGRYLEQERERVGRALQRFTASLESEAVAGPVRAAMRYALEAGGKRLRPILLVAAYRSVAGEAVRDAVYDVAVPLELIHTYSLVHDDLPCMDDDDVRRGRPSTHRAFDVETAMQAGLAMIPRACAVIEAAGSRLGLEPGRRMRLVAELCRAAGATGMVGGQVLDLEAENRDVPLGDLERIHARKTGALLTAAVRMGGIAARADAGTLDALDAYGRGVGLAFQIADDVLDVTGETAVLGKTAGSDRVMAKSTFAALLGPDEARSRARSEAESAIGALRSAGRPSPELEALARYAVERDK